MRKSAKSNKRAFSVRVKLPTGLYAFLDVTKYIGGTLPFEKPVATCAMEVSKDVVAFSLIHLNKHSSQVMKDRELGFPVGAVARLLRKGGAYKELGDNELVVNINGIEERFELERGQDGSVSIPNPGNLFELEYRPTRVDMFLKSPGTGRVLAVGFGGHFGSAGSQESMGRAAGKVLRGLSGLGTFKALSGIESVDLPKMPGSSWTTRVFAVENISRPIRVELLDDDSGEKYAEGEVTVELDMANADPATQRFMFHLHPSDSLKEAWSDSYQNVMRTSIDLQYANLLGVDVENLVYAIVLGEIAEQHHKTLDQALHVLPAMQLTPTRWRAL